MVFEVIRSHLTKKLGVFGVIWGQNPNILNPRQIIYQNEALDSVKVIPDVTQGHLTPKLLGIRGLIGSNPKIFKIRQIIYQNEALATLRA